MPMFAQGRETLLKARIKGQLFGGALHAAGLSWSALLATTASANFEPAEPVGVIGQWGNWLQIIGGPVNDVEVNFDAAFNDPLFASLPGLTMSAYAHADAMGGTLLLIDPTAIDSYADIHCVQWFTVPSVQQVLVEWNLGDVAGGVALAAYFENDLLVGDQSGSVGAATATLIPGTLYYFAMQMSIFESIDYRVESYARMTVIPAPAAWGLLGVASLLVRARRRPEGVGALERANGL